MAYELLGKDFTPPDLLGKVTGAAKYANDFQVDGMTHARLLVSPMPHGRVTRLDPSRALATPGVLAVLTADDLPAVSGATEPILRWAPSVYGLVTYTSIRGRGRGRNSS